MAARLHSNLAIFHANVVGPSTSETDAAREVARHLKLDLKAVEVAEQGNLDLMIDVMLHYGTSLFVPSQLGTVPDGIETGPREPCQGSAVG